MGSGFVEQAIIGHLAEVYCRWAYMSIIYRYDDTNTVWYGVELAPGTEPVYIEFLKLYGNIVDSYPNIQAALSIRDYIASNLQVGVEDVHINSYTEDWYTGAPVFTARYNNLNIGAEADWYGAFNLTSVVNRDNPGVDLYVNAVNSLNTTANPSSYTLASWNMDQDGNFIFNFSLQDGSIIGIGVDSVTGNADMLDQDLENALALTRGDIASKVGSDIQTVHIDGVVSVPYNGDEDAWVTPGPP